MAGNRHQEIETYSDGEVIVREGDPSRVMFVIQQGGAVVTKLVAGSEIVLATLDRGCFFGEMSLLEGLPRSATVRARGEARVLVINPGGLLLKIRRDPTFALEMLQQLSRRVRRLDEALVSVLENGQLSADEPDEIQLLRRVSEYAIAGGKAENGR